MKKIRKKETMEMVKEKEQAEQSPQAPKVTRAEKTKRQKAIVRLLLKAKDYKWNDLLEEATKKYLEKHSDEELDVADLKGKIGSSFSLMEEDGEVAFDKKTSVCSLVKKDRKQMKKKEEIKEESKKDAPVAETTAKKRGRKKKEESDVDGAKNALEGAKQEEKPVEKPVEKKKTVRAKAAKTAEKAEVAKKTEEAAEIEQKQQPKEEEKVEKKEAKSAPVFDVTAFLGNKSTEKKEEKVAEKPVAKTLVKPVEKEEKKSILTEFAFLGNAGLKAKAVQKAEEVDLKKEEKEVKAEAKPESKEEKLSTVQQPKTQAPSQSAPQKAEQPQRTSERRGGNENKKQTQVRGARTANPRANLTEDDKLKGEFLKRLRSLGGEYFEYYSVYLLERYSLKNGRRLEALRVSGGDRDGGIDGELELTDKFGFRETLYIQSKNWDDSKGDVEKWMVGETLLQQFVGAVACRQAKEGKRKCRGVFVTTAHFTEGAKEILENMSADFIGYDGDDVFETAKECRFGLIQKDGKWQLDEKLLKGEKAFFDLA